MKGKHLLCMASLLCITFFAFGYSTSFTPKEGIQDVPETRFVTIDPLSKNPNLHTNSGSARISGNELTVYILIDNYTQRTMWGCSTSSGCSVSSTTLLPVKSQYFPSTSEYMTMQKLVLDINPGVEDIVLFAAFAGNQIKELHISVTRSSLQ